MLKIIFQFFIQCNGSRVLLESMSIGHYEIIFSFNRDILWPVYTGIILFYFQTNSVYFTQTIFAKQKKCTFFSHFFLFIISSDKVEPLKVGVCAKFLFFFRFVWTSKSNNKKKVFTGFMDFTVKKAIIFYFGHCKKSSKKKANLLAWSRRFTWRMLTLISCEGVWWKEAEKKG